VGHCRVVHKGWSLPPPAPPDLVIAAIALFVATAVCSPATLVAVAIALPPLPSLLPMRHPHRHHHCPCRPRPCPLHRPSASSPSPSPTSLPSPSPSPSSPLLARHPRRHRSAVAIALFVARHPRRQCHPSSRHPHPLRRPPPSFPSPLPFPPLPSSSLPSSSAARYRRSSSPTVVVVWLPHQLSLASHRPPLSIPSLVDCCSPSVTIALVTVARPPPSSPSLLPPSPLPSSSHATLVADAMAPAALAIFVDRHPYCRHHRPCHPCPLCHCHHHPPHSLVVCPCPPSW
jgi:hypothetical protein